MNKAADRPTQALSRRSFLLAAGAGSAAAAAALAAGRATTRKVAAGGETRAKPGYRASEHVNNYYRTAKL